MCRPSRLPGASTEALGRGVGLLGPVGGGQGRILEAGRISLDHANLLTQAMDALDRAEPPLQFLGDLGMSEDDRAGIGGFAGLDSLQKLVDEPLDLLFLLFGQCVVGRARGRPPIRSRVSSAHCSSFSCALIV